MSNNVNILDSPEEQRIFSNVVTAFQEYGKYSLSANNKRRKDLLRIPLADRELLDGIGYKEKLDDVQVAITMNAKFLGRIVADPDIFSQTNGDKSTDTQDESNDHITNRYASERGHGHSHSHYRPTTSSSSLSSPYNPTDHDIDKVRSTLRQFVRDWSEEGQSEREACYQPMKDALLAHFADIPIEERGNFRVLVPGAGLARLAFDVAKLGFTCQGNEFSHHMLFASYFILNKTNSMHAYTIYPYIHTFSNASHNANILQSVSIPDILPSLHPGAEFSLVAGDFEEVYGEGNPEQLEQWDAVMTCFFIDTARNIVNYLRILYRILAPGGIWINLGPLLWHFENSSSNDVSIELSLEEVKALARKVGFEISNERVVKTAYTMTQGSMLNHVYHASFWTATKIT